jgi:hypothetical protein
MPEAAIFLSVAAPLFPNLRLACYKAVVSLRRMRWGPRKPEKIVRAPETPFS